MARSIHRGFALMCDPSEQKLPNDGECPEKCAGVRGTYIPGFRRMLWAFGRGLLIMWNTDMFQRRDARSTRSGRKLQGRLCFSMALAHLRRLVH